MARTLQQLKENVERLIQKPGEDAPVAAFIFTNEDVYEMSEDGDQQYFSVDVAHQVLDHIEGDYDYLYEEIFNCIDNELKELKLIK